MGKTIRLKGNAARGFIAASLVDADGEGALSKVSEGSPLWHQVKAEIESRRPIQVDPSIRPYGYLETSGSDGDE